MLKEPFLPYKGKHLEVTIRGFTCVSEIEDLVQQKHKRT